MTKPEMEIKPLVIIPARMQSSRLPSKPLADIAGKPMIVHVLQRAQLAKIGPVIVACAEEEIAQSVRTAGGQAILTDPDLPSGTDRIRVAADIFDPEHQFNCIVNVQGDLPTLDPVLITRALEVLMAGACDIATLAVPTTDPREISDPNVVKAVISKRSANSGRALYFTRAPAPSGAGPLYHHIGIYVYKRAALDAFCALSPSPLEKRERLEQLRALEADMRIDVAIVNSAPEGVDTFDDLERARAVLAQENL